MAMLTIIVCSVEHILCMIMVSVMIFIVPLRSTTLASLSQPSASPTSLPSTLPFQPLKRGDEQHHHNPPNQVSLEDYGGWNPNPVFDRGHVAPIPHKEDEEEESFMTLLNSFQTNYNVDKSEIT